MKRTARLALIAWGAITILIAASLQFLVLWHGPDELQVVIQNGPISNLTVTLSSVAMTWLLAGLFLFLLSKQRIDNRNVFLWTGFFLIALVYLNVLRERPEYGDIDYYVRAAQNLHTGLPLPNAYLYPPLWANMLEFLVPFGEKTIFLITWNLNLFSLLAAYFLLAKTLERYHFSPRLAALTTTLFLLVNTTVLRTLFYVQVNLHVLNLILLGMLFFRRHPFLSALSMALAVHFKTSPAVLILAFLLELDWKWLLWFAVSMIIVALPTLALHGVSPFMDFLHNALQLAGSHGLSFRDSSFDSLFTAIGELFNFTPILTRGFIYLSKAVLAIAVLVVMAKSVRNQMFLNSDERGVKVFNAVPPLLILMTLSSPVVWEHHGIFLALSFLLILKRLETPKEWTWFGAAYFLEFLLPTFDFFPWSYGRLVAPLIILWLMWKDKGRRTEEPGTEMPWFRALNSWAEELPALKN